MSSPNLLCRNNLSCKQVIPHVRTVHGMIFIKVDHACRHETHLLNGREYDRPIYELAFSVYLFSKTIILRDIAGRLLVNHRGCEPLYPLSLLFVFENG